MNVLNLIETKRDGGSLTPEDIHYFVRQYAAGKIPDYQASTLLMAIYLRGLSRDETRALTLAMRDSGKPLTWPSDSRPLVDKHSTGGVGDKVSLVLAPFLAAMGFRVPMISGRGLGITGGTLDKLETIPGFRSDLTRDAIIKQVQDIGCVICSASDDIAPADRALYALRDVTGTVGSVPLIVASILSKKLSAGLSSLVLDVKVGTAAFMGNLDAGKQLARELVHVAAECGLKARAVLTNMDRPLGRAVGNWLEVREAVDCLRGGGPSDLRELVLTFAHELTLGGRASSRAALVPANGGAGSRGRSPSQDTGEIQKVLDSGAAYTKFRDMIEAQGADLRAFDAKLERASTALIVRVVCSEKKGYVAACDARVIGAAVRDLGAGRLRKDQTIDGDVGMDQLKQVGEAVDVGEALGRIHARDEAAASKAEAAARKAFDIQAAPQAVAPLILGSMG